MHPLPITFSVSRKYVYKQTLQQQQRPILPVSDSFVILSKSQVHPSSTMSSTATTNIATNINISHQLKSTTAAHSESPSLSKTSTKVGTSLQVHPLRLIPS
ncbi:unnamed protein product [Cunninghamella echinulata]